MRLRLITPAAAPPVSLAEAKAQLRIADSEDDTMIVGLVSAAVGQLDGRNGMLGRALVTQTWEMVLDTFPAGQITVPLPPLQTVESIKYQNDANVQTTLDPSEYVVDALSEPGLIFPVDAWPSTYFTPNAVVIRFTAGYGAADAVPEPIKSAIKLRVQSLYDNLKPDDAAAIDRAHSALVFPFQLVMV